MSERPTAKQRDLSSGWMSRPTAVALAFTASTILAAFLIVGGSGGDDGPTLPPCPNPGQVTTTSTTRPCQVPHDLVIP